MEDTKFYFKNGKIVHDIKEFYEYIKSISKEEYTHHVSSMKNDFSEWIEHSVGNKELASRVKNATNVEEVESLIALEVRQISELAQEDDDELDDSENEYEKPEEEKFEDKLVEPPTEDSSKDVDLQTKDTLEYEKEEKEDLFESSEKFSKPEDSLKSDFEKTEKDKETNIFDLRDEREKKENNSKEEIENDIKDLISKEEQEEIGVTDNPYANTERKQIFTRVKKPNAPMNLQSYLMFKELLFGIMFGIILGMILMAIILSI